MLGKVLVHRQFVAHGVQAGTGNDHGFRLAANLALHALVKVSDHDADFLVDGVRMQFDEGFEQERRLALVVARIVLDRLPQPPVGRIRGVVAQHIQNEALLDGLPHAVAMKRCKGAVRARGSEQFQRLGLGRGGEGEGRKVGQPPALLHLGQNRVLQRFFGGFGGGFLALRVRQGGRGQHGFEAFRAFPGLRRVRLVDDQGKALARQRADFFGDHRKFLQGGYDNGFARLQRVLELARSRIDVFHHAQRRLELAYGPLELAIQHAAVRNHHNGIENAAIFRVVQRSELMRKPGDGKAFAAARRMLDEVLRARPPRAGVGNEFANAIQLLIARKNQESLARLATGFVLVLYFVNELAHQIKHAVPRPGCFPKIGCGVAGLRGRGGRIAGPAEFAPIVGKKARPALRKMRRYVDQMRIYGEMGQAAAIRKQRLAGVAVRFVLPHGVLDVLAGERVLEFGGEKGDAVQKQRQIKAFFVLGAIMDLPDDGKEICLV